MAQLSDIPASGGSWLEVPPGRPRSELVGDVVAYPAFFAGVARTPVEFDLYAIVVKNYDIGPCLVKLVLPPLRA